MEVSETPEGRRQDWVSGWEQGQWDFVYTQPGKVLSQHFEKLTGGRKGLKILVPLSATSYDLIWLCEQGHIVVGTDLGEQAADRMFKQYKQKPIIEDMPSIGGKLYKNSSGSFKYYVGDFLKFTSELEGKFDFIWDTGAMCAVDKRDRNKYLDVIRNVMGPKCIMMLEFPRDQDGDNAPYHFTEDDVKSFLGDICDVEYLGESSFDFSKVIVGTMDDEGKPVVKDDPDTTAEMSGAEYGAFLLDCYVLKKRV